MLLNKLKVNRVIIDKDALQNDLEASRGDPVEMARRVASRRELVNLLTQTEAERVAKLMIAPPYPFRPEGFYGTSKDRMRSIANAEAQGRHRLAYDYNKELYDKIVQPHAKEKPVPMQIPQRHEMHSSSHQIPTFAESQHKRDGRPVGVGDNSRMKTTNQYRK